MRRLFCTLLALAVALLAGCGRQQDNALVIYSAGPRPLIEQISADFTAHTGIPVRLFVATTGQLMAKLEAERFRPQADIVIFASDVAAEAMKEAGRLSSLNDLFLDSTLPLTRSLSHTHNDWHDPDGYYLATGAALVGVALGATVADSTPDWPLLFGGNFPGRIAMPSPSRSGTAGDFVVAQVLNDGDHAWRDFARARAAGMEFPAANSQALTSLLIGNYQAVVGAVDYLVFRQIEQGAPLAMHYPASGVPLMTRPVAILASTPHPAEARLFVRHFFTDAAQQQIAAAHLMPASRHIPVSPVRAGASAPAQILRSDVQRALAQQGSILRRFQYQIERAQIPVAEMKE